MDIEKNKELFINQLLSTKRDGIDQVLNNLDKIGFYDSPASKLYHHAYKGGLLEHSIQVLNQFNALMTAEMTLNPKLNNIISSDSIIICSLLHDLCKAGLYKEVTKWRKDKNNKWEQYTTYDSDQSSCPLGHGEKSVIRLLQWGLKLSKEEILAIRWHMGAFDISDYPDSWSSFNEATKIPLVSLLISSDWLSSKIPNNEIIKE